jgi:hypothetical protein
MVTFASMRQWLPITTLVADDCAGADGCFIADLDAFA